MVIYMLKIRRPLGRLIFNMGIAIPGKTFFLIETAPWFTENLNKIHFFFLLFAFRLNVSTILSDIDAHLYSIFTVLTFHNGNEQQTELSYADFKARQLFEKQAQQFYGQHQQVLFC